MCSARSVFLDLFYFQSILWSEFEEYLQFMDWKYLKFWLIALEPRSDELQIQQIDINQKGANMSTIMFGKLMEFDTLPTKNFRLNFFTFHCWKGIWKEERRNSRVSAACTNTWLMLCYDFEIVYATHCERARSHFPVQTLHTKWLIALIYLKSNPKFFTSSVHIIHN